MSISPPRTIYEQTGSLEAKMPAKIARKRGYNGQRSSTDTMRLLFDHPSQDLKTIARHSLSLKGNNNADQRPQPVALVELVE